MSARVAKFLLEMIQGRNQMIFLGATKPKLSVRDYAQAWTRGKADDVSLCVS